MVISGDVKPDEAFALAQSTFGAIPRRPVPPHVTAKPVVHSGRTIQQTGDVPFTTVDFVYALPGQTDRAVIAPLLISLAAENARSPIRSALVNSQIALQYSAEPVLTMRGSLFHLMITLAPGRTVQDARNAWETAFRATFIDGYPSDLIDAAKRAAIVQDVYDRDSLTGLGELVGNSFGVEGGRYPNRDNDDIARETQAQVQDAARIMFAKPTVVAILRPQAAKPGQVQPASAKSTGISDTFSGRVPTGKVVEAPWVRAALHQVSTLASHVAPVLYTLPNGLRLLVQEAHDNATVSIAGVVETSPRSDPPGKEGLTGIVSSLMSYGSSGYSFERQRTIADDLAAEVRYGTSFGAHGLSRDFQTLLDLVADDVKNPTLPSEYFPLIRDAIKSNVERRHFDPEYRASRASPKPSSRPVTRACANPRPHHSTRSRSPTSARWPRGCCAPKTR